MPHKKKEERTIERGSFLREKEKSHALALCKETQVSSATTTTTTTSIH
jgi:hypothetical protein